MLARVYYTQTPGGGGTVKRAWIVALAVVGLTAGTAQAQHPSFTLTPAMTKGPANAPVTIVQFSDYQ